MSRERELLERATEALKFWMDETSHSVDWELLEDLESYLSTPEPTQEPIGYVITIDPDKSYRKDSWVPWKEVEGMNGGKIRDDIPDGSFVYLHPAPRPEFVRLSEEELRSCFTETNEAEPLAEGWPGLERFAQAIEHALEEKNK